LQDIESALAEDRIALVFQRVLSIPDGDAIQAELFSQLARADGQPISAATFIPMASQYGLLPTLDRKVIARALASLAANPDLPRTISVNLSLQSLLDGAFREWLRTTLKADPAAARRLTFEMTGGAASRSAEAARDFSLELRRLGSRLALDNFEVDRNSIALVHELRLAYVKLAPVFTREISTREDVRFIVEAVLRAFRPLEVPIIAQGVEDAALLPVLAEIGVAGYQGYVAGRPEPLRSA
jgi:EAL domain-containing protein (putative c-di-GMP-specific phosphodiesterase class I)